VTPLARRRRRWKLFLTIIAKRLSARGTSGADKAIAHLRRETILAARGPADLTRRLNELDVPKLAVEATRLWTAYRTEIPWTRASFRRTAKPARRMTP
jgi:hypothetical protein